MWHISTLHNNIILSSMLPQQLRDIHATAILLSQSIHIFMIQKHFHHQYIFVAEESSCAARMGLLTYNDIGICVHIDRRIAQAKTDPCA